MSKDKELEKYDIYAKVYWVSKCLSHPYLVVKQSFNIFKRKCNLTKDLF